MTATGAPPVLEPPPAASRRLRALTHALPARCALYGVIDVNRDEGLYDALHAEPEESAVACLYDGQAALRYGRYAPYLVTAHHASPILQRWLSEGWDAHWGIFLASNASAAKLKRHLKRFITALDPKGRKTWLRFYDPQILHGILAAMYPGQLYEWFGGGLISACLAPGPDGLWRLMPKTNLLDKLVQTVQLQNQLFKVDQK